MDFIHRRSGGCRDLLRGQPARHRAAGRVHFPGEWQTTGVMGSGVGPATRPAAVRVKDGRTSIPLQFEPYGGMFVVFRKASGGRAQGSGKNFPELKPLQEITGAWTVQFDPQWFYPTNGLTGDPLNGVMVFDNWKTGASGRNRLSTISAAPPSIGKPLSLPMNPQPAINHPSSIWTWAPSKRPPGSNSMVKILVCSGVRPGGWR